MTRRRLLVVGLDMDGVFADFVGHPDTHGFCRLLVRACKRDLFPRPWLGATLWDWMTPLGYTRADMDSAWRLVKQGGFWSGLRPLAGALDTLWVVNKLREQGYLDPYFLTTRPGDQADAETVTWLRGMGVKSPRVVICANADAKGVAARDGKLDLVVDDHCENLLAIKARSKARIVLYDQPWSTPNRDRVLSCGALVVRDQQQLADKLKEWAGV